MTKKAKKPPHRPAGGMLEQLDRGQEDMLRAWHALPDVLRTMRDAMVGQPKAQHYNVTARGPSSEMWCDDHERPVAICHRAEEWCKGVPVLSSGDPAGDAAVEAATNHDEASADHREVQRLCAEAEHVGDRLVRIVQRWQARAATEKDRRESADKADPGCEFHARVGSWVPPFVLSSTVAGALDHPVRACRDCYERIRSTGKEPTKGDLEHHVANGRWPRARAA